MPATSATAPTNPHAERLRLALSLLMSAQTDEEFEQAKQTVARIAQMTPEDVEALANQSEETDGQEDAEEDGGQPARFSRDVHANDAEALGWFYADLLGDLEDAGHPADDATLVVIDDELAGSGWHLNRDDVGRWYVQLDPGDDESEEADPEEAEEFDEALEAATQRYGRSSDRPAGYPPEFERFVKDGHKPVFDEESGQWLIGDQFDTDDDPDDWEEDTTARHGRSGGVLRYEWVNEPGPRSRRRWKNTETGEIRYADHKPGSEEHKKAEEDKKGSILREQLSKPATTHPPEGVALRAAYYVFQDAVMPAHDDFHKLIGAPSGAEVVVYAFSDKELRLTMDHPAIQRCDRTISQDPESGLPVCHNDYFFLKKKYRGGGLGLEVFSSQVREMANAGVAKIETVAGKGGIMNGYYTWPRLGYDARLESDWAEKAPRKLYLLLTKQGVAPEEARRRGEAVAGAKTVQDLFKTEDGRALWKKHGYMTEMAFDLAPGSNSIKVLNSYLKSKGKPLIEVDADKVRAGIEQNKAEQREQLRLKSERVAQMVGRIKAKARENGIDFAEVEGLADQKQADQEKFRRENPQDPKVLNTIYDPVSYRVWVLGRIVDDMIDESRAYAEVEKNYRAGAARSGIDPDRLIEEAHRQQEEWNQKRVARGEPAFKSSRIEQGFLEWVYNKMMEEKENAQTYARRPFLRSFQSPRRIPLGSTLTVLGVTYHAGSYLPADAAALLSPTQKSLLDRSEGIAYARADERALQYRIVKAGTAGAIKKEDKRGRTYWVDKETVARVAKKGNVPKGPVDREKLSARLGKHKASAEFTPAERKHINSAFRMIARHHGENALGRIQQLVDELEPALETATGTKRVEIQKQLARLHHMESQYEQMQGGGKKGSPDQDRSMPTKELKVDPQRFQFKLNVDKSGVTQQFKNVESFNPDFAGVIAVWKDPADGQTYVVNGHHRHEMATRFNYPALRVRYIDAKDAKEARAQGALINIADDRGTAVDAAKFMRDMGVSVQDFKKYGVSLDGPVARDAVILSHLNDRLFHQLALGTMPLDRALAIAGNLPDVNLQDQLVNVLEKEEERRGQDIPPRVVAEMAKEIAATPITRKTEKTLFGDEETQESLFVYRNELKSYVRAELAKEMNDWLAVANKRRAGRVASGGNVLDVEANKEAAQQAEHAKNLFDTLVNRKGAISDALNTVAEQYVQASRKSEKDKVKRQAVEAVRDAIIRELEGAGNETDRGAEGEGLPGGDAAGATEPGAGAEEAAAESGRGDAVNAGLDPEQLRLAVQKETHKFKDVAEGKYKVGVEGRGGKDIQEAKERGMFTTLVNGVPVYAKTEADAKPLIDYLESGGKYGTVEFSRLLGYTDEQIGLYEKFLRATGQEGLLAHDPRTQSALARYDSRESLSGTGGGLFGGDDLRSRQQFAKLPDGTPVVITEGANRGKTGLIKHEANLDGSQRIVLQIDGQEGTQPTAPTAVEPLDAHLSWRTEAGANSTAKQGGMFSDVGTMPKGQSEAAQNVSAINKELNALVKSGESSGTVRGVPVERAGLGRFKATIGGKKLEGDLAQVSNWIEAESSRKKADAAPPVTSPEGSAGQSPASPKSAQSVVSSLDDKTGEGYSTGGSETPNQERQMSTPEPIKSKTKRGTDVTLTPVENQYGKPAVRVEMSTPALNLDFVSESFGRVNKDEGIVFWHAGKKVCVTVPKEDYDTAITEAKKIGDAEVAAIKDGSKPISVRYNDGSTLSGYSVGGRAAKLLKDLGLAEDVSGWGTLVNDKVVKALGESFTYPQAEAFAKPEQEAKKARQQAKEEKTEAHRSRMLAEAKASGEPKAIWRQDDGNQYVIEYAMPDGTTRMQRYDQD